MKTSRIQRLVLIVSILASIVAFLDGSVVSVATPAIMRELGGGLSLQQWVNDAYLITLGTLILAAGSLSDIFGRKRILTYGLVGFLVTSLLCALAPSGVFLSIMRAFQGIAGALIVPSSLAIIISVFKGPAQARAIGQWTAWTGISFIAGPLVGGLLVDFASWRWVFAINVVPIAISLFLLTKITIDEPNKTRAKVDVAGIILGALGLGGIVYALIEQGTFGPQNPIIWGTFIVGILLLIAFVLHQRRTPSPILPLGLFKVRNFSVGNMATIFVYAGLSLQGFVLTIFLQQVSGYPATFAGLAAAPITVIMFFLASKFGALSGTYGPRLFMGIGPFVAAAGLLLMTTANVPTNYWLTILPGILVFGLGLSMIVAPLTSAILGSIPNESSGIGSAINNAASRIAGLVAIAVIGIIVGGSITLGGFKNAVIFSALLLVVGGVISLVGIKNPKRDIEQPVS